MTAGIGLPDAKAAPISDNTPGLRNAADDINTSIADDPSMARRR
jgi:hypothetical protein